jgi:protein-S-isoprenylcysteine O-methyltransferase Ste14
MDPVLNLMVIGFVVALSGEMLRLWAVSYIGSESRTTSGVGGSNLVTQGPFSLMRNPLYIGNIMLYVGIGIMSNAFFPWLPIIAFLYFVFQYYVIIINEEDYLRETYKDKFVQYCKSTNRFLPWFNRLPDEIKSDLSFDIKAGFRSERRSIQAFVTVTCLITIFYLTNFRIYPN